MSPERGYRKLFDTYVVAGVEASLVRAGEATHPLTDNERQQAWHMLSYALAIEDAWSVASQLLLTLAPKMAYSGYWSEWIPYLERGLVQSRTMRTPGIEAEVALHLAYLHQRLGQLAQADQRVSEAVALFARQHNHRRQRAALNRHAEIRRSRRDFAAVARLTDAALDLLKSEADPDFEEHGHSFLIKGRAAYDQGIWSLAGRNFEYALGFYEQTENLGRIAVCIQNLGRVCYQQEDYSGAITHDRRAIKLLEANNDVFNLAVVQMNLGIVYSLCGRPEAALEQYSRAEVVFRRLQDRANLARLFTNQGIEMNNLERWDDAEALFHASSELWLALDNLQWYLNAQDMLGLAYIGRKDFDHAIQLYEEAMALSEKQAERGIAERTLASLAKHLHSAEAAREEHLQLS